jgi:hypothetical protein
MLWSKGLIDLLQEATHFYVLFYSLDEGMSHLQAPNILKDVLVNLWILKTLLQ